MPAIAGRPARLFDLENSEIGVGVLPIVLRMQTPAVCEQGERCNDDRDSRMTTQGQTLRVERSAHHQHRDGDHRSANSDRQCDKRAAGAEAGLDVGLAAADLPEQSFQVSKRDRRREERIRPYLGRLANGNVPLADLHCPGLDDRGPRALQPPLQQFEKVVARHVVELHRYQPGIHASLPRKPQGIGAAGAEMQVQLPKPGAGGQRLIGLEGGSTTTTFGTVELSMPETASFRV